MPVSVSMVWTVAVASRWGPCNKNTDVLETRDRNELWEHANYPQRW